jgi:hypothetical protein
MAKNNYPTCDYGGTCKNKAHREVHPSFLGGKYKNDGWSYLCRKHFEQEQKKFKGKLPYCTLDKDNNEIRGVALSKGQVFMVAKF